MTCTMMCLRIRGYAGDAPAAAAPSEVNESTATGVAAPAAAPGEPDVSALDIRVGKIISCSRHPDAEVGAAHHDF